MKVTPIFIKGGTYVSRIQAREGPVVSFVCRYKGSCVIKYQKKEIIKFCQMTKGTATREEFDAWWDQYCLQDEVAPDLDLKKVKKEGWGPEAHQEESNDNPKLVTPLKKGSKAEAKTEAGGAAQSSSSGFEEKDPTEDTKIVI